MRRALGVALSGLLLVPAAAEGADKPPSTPTTSATPYQLPIVGKPRRRIGGGRRGPGDPLPELWALVPEHVGLTTSAAPSLYWYLGGEVKPDARFELTLIDERSALPVLETRVPTPAHAGLQQVRLADHGVELVPGQEYQWSLALVVDPAQRSRDLVTSGWVERIAESPELAARLAASPADARARVYAEAGLWYDALAATTDAQSRNALLEQVGLPALP